MHILIDENISRNTFFNILEKKSIFLTFLFIFKVDAIITRLSLTKSRVFHILIAPSDDAVAKCL